MPKKKGIDPFEDAVDDLDHLTDDEDESGEDEDGFEDDEETDDEEEEVEKKRPVRPSARNKKPEPKAEEPEDEDEEDDEEDVDLGFAPYIISESAEWEIGDLVDQAEAGEAIFLYKPPVVEATDEDDEDFEPIPAKWFKLVPVTVGELSN